MEFTSYQYIVFPMASLVIISFVVVVSLFRARSSAVREGKISAGYFKTYVGADEPEESRKLAQHFTNLFETPVLFYVACLAALSLKLSFGLFLIFAWCYVLLRLAHAIIHIGRNKLIQRIVVYFSSWLVLLVMWSILIYRILGGV